MTRKPHGALVRLALREESDGLLLEVSDNGRGIKKQEYVDPTTLGLRGMQERVALFGGTLHIDGDPETGTTVRAWIPQRREHVEDHTTSAV